MIDEEIREALDVDPSPQFLARVRTRIATEPAPANWRWSWTIAAGALAAAAMVAIVLTPAREKAVGPVTQTAEADRRGSAIPQTGSGPSATERRPDSLPKKRKPGSASAARSRLGVGESIVAAPEVLLDPAETRALHQLIAGVRDGHVDLAAVQQALSGAPMDLDPIADIVIAPISIEPLAPQGAQGEQP